MPGATTIERNDKPGYAACSGCSLCLLVCPVWRGTHDLRLTPHGRAKALQHGATADDIAASVDACTLCGACEPVCPENIALVDMVISLRRALPLSTIARNLQTRFQAEIPHALVTKSAAATVLLTGMTLAWEQMLLARARAALGGADKIAVAADHGADIAMALELGAVVPPQRIERFLAPLRQHMTIIAADGLLLRHLRAWLPKSKIVSLGEALSSRAAVRKVLTASDLYVIEPRAYHADHARLVTHYDNLRAETGCAINLDLQRIAVPATMSSLHQLLGRQGPSNRTQVHWLLKGRQISRIVVENVDDRSAFQQQCDIPVVYLAEVADDGRHENGQL